MRTSCATLSTMLFWAVTASAASLPPQTLDPLANPLSGMRAGHAPGSPEGKVSWGLRAAPVGPLAGGLVPADAPRAADGRLHVYLDCSPLGSAELAALAAAGVSVERVKMDTGRVQARVDPARSIGRRLLVGARDPQRRPRGVRAGSVTTEGDAARAPTASGPRASTATASSSASSPTASTACSAAQQTNDLPDVVVPNDSRCQKGAGDEGTALLEIVHDVAPGAKLLFSGPASSLEMVDAVECLVDAGANVIVDDLGLLRRAVLRGWSRGRGGARRGDGRRLVSLVGRQRSGGAPRGGLRSLPRGRTTVHDFAAGAGDNTNSVVVPAGGTLTCILQWNDPFGAAADDYDLVHSRRRPEPRRRRASTRRTAHRTRSSRSTVVNQTDTDQLANVLIDRFAGEPRRLELFCLGAAALEHGDRRRQHLRASGVAVGGRRRRHRRRRSRPRRRRGLQLARARPASTSRPRRSAPSRISSRSTASRSRTPAASRPARPSAPSSARRRRRRTRRVSRRCSSTRIRA